MSSAEFYTEYPGFLSAFLAQSYLNARVLDSPVQGNTLFFLFITCENSFLLIIYKYKYIDWEYQKSSNSTNSHHWDNVSPLTFLYIRLLFV